MLDPIIDFEKMYLMIDKYLGELYCQTTIEASTGRSFDYFFQTDLFDVQKGVVQIDLGTLT